MDDYPWETVRHEQSTMIHHDGLEEGWTWEGCAVFAAEALLVMVGSFVLIMAYASRQIELGAQNP